MNRILSVFFLLFILSFSSRGQGKTYVGVQSGVSFATANIFSTFQVFNIEERFTTGYQTGVVVMNYLQPHIGVQAGVNYIQKGWRQTFVSDEKDVVTNLDYIEIPILLNIRTGKESLHFFANLGCFGELLVGNRVSDEPASIPTPTTFSPKGLPLLVSDGDGGFEGYIPFDRDRDRILGYGLKGGVGSFYDFKFGTLMLELSASYSVSDVFDSGDFERGIPNVSKKITAGITLGYLIPFGAL